MCVCERERERERAATRFIKFRATTKKCLEQLFEAFSFNFEADTTAAAPLIRTYFLYCFTFLESHWLE